MFSSSNDRPFHGDQPAMNNRNARQQPMAEDVPATERVSAQSSSSTTHRRTDLNSQRTRERRTQKVAVTETLTRRTSSSDQRTRPAGDQPKHVRPTDIGTKPSSSSRPKVKASKPEIEISRPVWSPEVSLIAPTSAPLASRISLPPKASQSPISLQPVELRVLSLEAQEATIIEDLLMVLMGYEGQYIHLAKTYNPSAEEDRLSGPIFVILPGLDPSLRDLTIEILEIATHYGALQSFIDVQGRAELGVVNQALTATIRKLMCDYLALVAQLETQFLCNPSFTLHVLNVHTFSTRHLMSQVYSLAQAILTRSSLSDDDEHSDMESDIKDILEALQSGDLPSTGRNKTVCKGGSVLGLTTKRLEAFSGDPAARAILTSLLRDASRPYMRMLNEWLYHGVIKDLYGEFLVKEQKSMRLERLSEDYTDDYWERRYTLRDNIPPQLASLQHRVLLAGKYLNVVRECGGVDISKAITNVPITFDDPRFVDNINDAYVYANKFLLNLLLTTYALPARLHAMKHYFFLSQSDFLSYFLDLASTELRKPVDKVNTSKLQALLDLVLPAQDPFRENIKVGMNDTNLIDGLTRVINISGMEDGDALPNPPAPPVETEKAPTGFTSLQFDCIVPFPASLVISRKTVWRYQVLFRFLFSLRHLERQLVSNWQTLNKAPGWAHKSSNRQIEVCKRRASTLQARMLVYVQQLLYYSTAEVMEPNWQGFMEKLEVGSKSAVSTVDELMQNHVDFLDTCLKECMLTNSRLLRRHSKLMQTCTLFSTFLPWFSRELESNDPDLSSNTKPSCMPPQQRSQLQNERKQSSIKDAGTTTPQFEKMLSNLRKFEISFGRHMSALIDELNHFAATETVVLLGLCAKLSDVHQSTDWRESGSKTGDGLDS
ncbi:Spindle pole body component alp4 [Lachnellula suecica]|uniref:Spindle pole body component n=1 Tax=Lachnellula suecica TaxID=602035 RepID=A0A8T9CIS1_9HELO|nr:Spindle pole body component alp4 [Lachnellula suecica]